MEYFITSQLPERKDISKNVRAIKTRDLWVMIGPIEHGYETYDPLPPATASSIHTTMSLSSQSFSDMTPLPPRLCPIKTKHKGSCKGGKKSTWAITWPYPAALDLGLKWEFPTFRLTFIPLQMLFFDISVASLEAKFWQKRLPRFPTSKFESSERETAILRETLQACERNWKALTVVTVN